MKKKVLSSVALLLCAVFLCLSLTACGTQPQSAYDLAVANGFVGTEQQWLASLKGQDLNIEDVYAAAVADGNFTGTFLEFLSEYLSLDPDALTEAIVKYQEKDTSRLISLALLSSVSIQASSAALGSGSTISAGSGVIYSLSKNEGDAYIITNHHVVAYTNASGDGAIQSSIAVFLYGMQRTAENAIKATYIGGSSTYDLAVLKISNSDILRSSAACPIAYTDSDTVVAGADAIAIGNAAGQGISVTRGIVSIASQTVTVSSSSDKTQRVFQIDTSINEGNSGGGLFDRDGKLIGIVSAKVEAAGVDNIGYAIPSNIAVRIAQSLIDRFEETAVSPSFVFSPVALQVARLGINLEEAAMHAVYDEARGVTAIVASVTVSDVSDVSLAKTVGIRRGDIITGITVDGTVIAVNRAYSLSDAMFLCHAGSSVSISYVRNGSAGTLTFTVPTTAFETVE